MLREGKAGTYGWFSIATETLLCNSGADCNCWVVCSNTKMETESNVQSNVNRQVFWMFFCCWAVLLGLENRRQHWWITEQVHLIGIVLYYIVLSILLLWEYLTLLCVSLKPVSIDTSVFFRPRTSDTAIAPEIFMPLQFKVSFFAWKSCYFCYGHCTP